VAARARHRHGDQQLLAGVGEGEVERRERLGVVREVEGEREAAADPAVAGGVEVVVAERQAGAAEADPARIEVGEVVAGVQAGERDRRRAAEAAPDRRGR
jgi:hypothetical protein